MTHVLREWTHTKYVIIIYYATLIYTKLATYDVIKLELNQRWSHVMDEQQCLRPRERW